jgi:uncharacterized cupin superfamily protein
MAEKPNLPFRPDEVPESNFTSYPEPFRATNQQRFNRKLGDHAGLVNFGVNLTRIVPGGQSSARHAHSAQDEFIYVLSGTPVLETTEARQALSEGMCVGFPAGSGVAHRFLNEGDADVLLLVVGDRSAGDRIAYPDLNLQAELGEDGRYRFFTKDGAPYPR